MAVPSCDRPERDPATRVMVPRGKTARAHQERAQRGFAELLGGSPARVVWVADTSTETTDTFADGETLHLMGWDTREGGPRRLIANAGNFARPLLTPDGRHVVFTEKRLQRRDGARHYRPLIHVVDWEFGEPKPMGKGFAVAAWADPASGRVWIYALEKTHAAKQLSLTGSTLIRFPLDAPEQRETVWTRTRLSLDSVHVSRDGKRFAGLFPWPDAGIGDFVTGRWTKLDFGCWPALAPDDSYVAWVFDGSHRNLRLVAPAPERRWSVNLSSISDMRGKEAYHPRWSNHPQFIVFTGPYTKKKQGSRNVISSGGLSAEINVGKLAADASGLEATVRLTHNKTGDFYPDLWVGGTESTTLAGFPQQPTDATPSSPDWPYSPQGLVFVWRDLRAANEVPDDDRRPACHVEARGIGRFSAHLGALLDGGWFEADAESNAAIAGAVRAGRGLTVQALVTEATPASEGAPLPLVTWQASGGTPFLALERLGGSLRAVLDDGGAHTTGAVTLPPKTGEVVAIALVADGQTLRLAVNGQWTGDPVHLPDGWMNRWPDGRLVMGPTLAAPTSDPAHAVIERITVHAHGISIEEIAARAAADLAAVKDRAPSPPRLRVRARVVEATDPDLSTLDTYHRLLVDHTYEVIDVMEGQLDAKRIAVLHWAVLDDRPVPGFPRRVGADVELDLEPHAAHPELEGELTDLTSEEFGLPLFLDVATPAGL
ncbi:MAG: hypothetical protein ACKV19_27530 [Verrucomicrobiales bacterium]